MVILAIFGAAIALAIVLLLAVSRRDRRRGHHIRSADEITTRVVAARRAIRESEDRWHQNQIFGRAARAGRPERRRSAEYPWLG